MQLEKVDCATIPNGLYQTVKLGKLGQLASATNQDVLLTETCYCLQLYDTLVPHPYTFRRPYFFHTEQQNSVSVDSQYTHLKPNGLRIVQI